MNRARSLFLFAIFFCPSLLAQTHPLATARPIISPGHPVDSRGEIVYENQGKTQQDVPLVPGTLLMPKLINRVDPRYPESLLKAQRGAEITVAGIVSATGDFIDASAIGEANPEVAASALECVRQYRFRPATLDGKPVAVLIQVQFSYRIR